MYTFRTFKDGVKLSIELCEVNFLSFFDLNNNNLWSSIKHIYRARCWAVFES